MSIYFTSDTHFGHDREFIYKPRSFENIHEHDETIVKNWNNIVQPEDEVYHLGDVMLGNNENGLNYFRQLNGNIHIIRGNHDTDTRIKLFKSLNNVVEIVDAKYLRFKKYHFFLTHYPCLTGSLEKDSLKSMTCDFFGHTHQKNNFFEDRPFMYHVGMDSHNCTPIKIEDTILEMEAKVLECKELL